MQRDAVAVTGIGLLSCLGRGFITHRLALEELRTSLAASRIVSAPTLAHSPVGEVPDTLLDPAPGPRVLRLGRAAALDALAGASLEGRGLVAVGTTTGSVLESEEHHRSAKAAGGEPLWRMRHHPVGETAVALAASLGLDAECHTFATACSSSSNAIGYGALRVAAGVPWALVGGVDTMCLMTYAGFHALRLLSRGPPRPFDARRSGVSVAEGAAFLLLEPLERALERGAFVFGEVTGWGCAVDAFHQTAPDPAGAGAIASMRAALEEDGAGPADVGYINAHGTATEANDRVEALALNALFGSARPSVSSTKGFTGHTLGAAGALEAGLTFAAFASRRAPPSLGLAEHDAACELNHVPAAGARLEAPLALSNSFGFGGNNASLALRRAGSTAKRPRGPRDVRRVYVHGAGFAAPGAVGCAALRSALSGPARPFTGELTLDRTGGRLARLERLAIAAAREALGDGPHDGVALVAGTAYGRLDAVGDFLEGLAQRGVAHGSPFAFYQSVYHSLAGQLGIDLELRGIGLTTSAREATGENALRIGMDLICAGRAQSVLVVGADDAPPALRDRLPEEHPVRRAQPQGAVTGAAALLLSAEPSGFELTACELWRDASLDPARALGGSDDDVRFGLHPIRGLMRVVAAAVTGRSAELSGCGTGGLAARVRVEAHP